MYKKIHGDSKKGAEPKSFSRAATTFVNARLTRMIEQRGKEDKKMDCSRCGWAILRGCRADDGSIKEQCDGLYTCHDETSTRCDNRSLPGRVCVNRNADLKFHRCSTRVCSAADLNAACPYNKPPNHTLTEDEV